MSRQPPKDPLARGHIVYSTANNMGSELLFRLLFFPIWLPYKGWKTLRQRRQMAEFAEMRAKNVMVTDDVVKEIALEWVKDHPKDYFYREHDPKVPKLERTFRKILARKE